MTQTEFDALVAKINADSDGQFGPSMLDVEKMIMYAEKLRDALIWCSGSADFAPGGVAHDGWKKTRRLLE